MNKILIILPILVSLLTFSSQSNGDWTYVTANIEGTEYYIDFDRVKKRDDYIYTWILTDELEPTESGTLSYLSFEKIHCGIPKKSKRFTLKYCKDNFGKGKCETINEEKEWEYPFPDSAWEGLIDIVCSK